MNNNNWKWNINSGWFQDPESSHFSCIHKEFSINDGEKIFHLRINSETGPMAASNMPQGKGKIPHSWMLKNRSVKRLNTNGEQQISCFIVSDFAFLILELIYARHYFPLIITKTTGKKSAPFCNCQVEERSWINLSVSVASLIPQDFLFCKTSHRHSLNL